MKQCVYQVFYDTGLGYTTSSKRFSDESEAKWFATQVKSPKILKSELCEYGCENVDLGPGDRHYFTNYELTAYGNSYAELLVNATITEIDQDGGEVGDTIGIEDAPHDIAEAAINHLKRLVEPYRVNKLHKDQ